MYRPDKKRLYRKAIDKWGIDMQLCMLMEECAELIQATNKVIRKRKEDNQVWDLLVEEMADVEIMIEQIKMSVNWMLLEEKVQDRKEEKLRRLEEILNDKNIGVSRTEVRFIT